MARTTTWTFLGNTSQLNAAMDAAGLKAEETSTVVGDKMATASDKAGGSFAKLGAAIQGVTGIPIAGAFQKSGDAISDTDTKGKGLMGTAQGLGKALGVASVVGFGAVAIASVDLAQKFQSTVTSIAAGANIPVAAAQKIGNAFLDTAGTTIYSGQEMGQAYAGVAGQLGLLEGHALTAKQATDFMKVSMDLAEGSGTSLNASTGALSSVLQTFHMNLSQASSASDILFNSSRVLHTGVDDVAGSFTKLRGQLGAASPPLKDLGTLMVDLAGHGEANSRAMRSVTTSLAGLLTPTTAAAQTQAFLGVSFKDASGNMLPMRDIIGELNPIIEHMGSAQAAATLKALGFGNASGKLVQTIQAGVPAWDASAKGADKLGSAHEAAAKQSQTLAHQLDTAKATAIDLGTKLGDALIPKLEDLMKIIEKVVGWFEKHKTAAEALAIGLGVLAAALIGMSIAGAIAEATFSPIIAIVGAVIIIIALLVIGILYLSTHWKQVWSDIKKWFDDAVKFLRSGFGTLVLLIAGPVAPLLFLALHWQQIWNDIKNWTGDAIRFVSGLIDSLVNFFTAIPGRINHVWSDVVNALHAAWSAIANWVSSNIIDPVVNFFTSIPGKIAHVWSDVVSAIHGAWNAIANWVLSNIILPVVSFYESIPGKIAHVWSDVVSAIHGAWNDIANWVNTNIIQPVINFYASIPGKVAHVWSDVVSAIHAAWSDIANWVNSNIVQPIINFFSNIPSRVSGIASEVWSDFTGGIGSLASWVNNNVVQPIISFFTSLPGKVAGIGGQIVSKIVSEIAGAGGAILGAIKSIIPGPLQSVVSSVLGFLAEGGPATAGMPYIIGESGPELFIPSTSGVVIPNSVLSTPTSAVTPISASSGSASPSGSAAGGASLQVDLNLDGQRFATAIVPDLLTALYQKKRVVGTLELT